MSGQGAVYVRSFTAMDPQDENSESEDQIFAESVFDPRFVEKVNYHFTKYIRNVPYLEGGRGGGGGLG